MAKTAQAFNVLPAPRFAREGDFLHISTIYPIDATGKVVHTNAVSPFVGEAEIAAQTRAVLETLRSVLAEAGSSLERVVKAEVYLVDAADFYEFKLVWREFFPHDPPARATAVVGDDHIIPGARLSLSAVALAGNAKTKREFIHVNDAPDPLEAEWCAQAIKAAPFVFPSPVPATDFKSGIAAGRDLRAPNYGSDTELQLQYIFAQWAKILRAAGSGLDQALKAQAYERDLSNFHAMDRIWGEHIGRGAGTAPPTRSSMAMRELLVPGALLVPNMMFLAPDAGHQKTESRKGLRWHPEELRNVHYSPGIFAGDWFFMAGQVAITDYKNLKSMTAPPGLPHYFSDIEIQTAATMELLREQLEGNGLSLRNIVDARIFLVEPRRDYRGFERAWRRIFEPIGHWPSMNLIPSKQANGLGGVMMYDLIVEIDLTAHRQHRGGG
ncbi:MAG TPA: Rid family hydrolase [Candidatus Methylomirabilis sp.]|nr:Rid family hydrolase [Candidatus Methylomirabilis sp.]